MIEGPFLPIIKTVIFMFFHKCTINLEFIILTSQRYFSLKYSNTLTKMARLNKMAGDIFTGSRVLFPTEKSLALF